MKIAKIEVIHVKPRWSFVKVSTDEGIVGWGEAIVEGRSRTVERHSGEPLEGSWQAREVASVFVGSGARIISERILQVPNF